VRGVRGHLPLNPPRSPHEAQFQRDAIMNHDDRSGAHRDCQSLCRMLDFTLAPLLEIRHGESPGLRAGLLYLSHTVSSSIISPVDHTVFKASIKNNRALRIAPIPPRSIRRATAFRQPFPERIIIEGRSPCKSWVARFSFELALRSPPAVVVLPPRAQISIK
jgi:hypothetical protein